METLQAVTPTLLQEGLAGAVILIETSAIMVLSGAIIWLLRGWLREKDRAAEIYRTWGEEKSGMIHEQLKADADSRRVLELNAAAIRSLDDNFSRRRR